MSGLPVAAPAPDASRRNSTPAATPMKFIPKLLPGDWWCASGHYNYACREFCFRCQSSKSSGKVISGSQKGKGKGEGVSVVAGSGPMKGGGKPMAGPKGGSAKGDPKGKGKGKPDASVRQPSPVTKGGKGKQSMPYQSPFQEMFADRAQELESEISKLQSLDNEYGSLHMNLTKRRAEAMKEQQIIEGMQKSLDDLSSRVEMMGLSAVSKAQAIQKAVMWKRNNRCPDGFEGYWDMAVARTTEQLKLLRKRVGDLPQSPQSYVSRSRSAKTRGGEVNMRQNSRRGSRDGRHSDDDERRGRVESGEEGSKRVMFRSPSYVKSSSRGRGRSEASDRSQSMDASPRRSETSRRRSVSARRSSQRSPSRQSRYEEDSPLKPCIRSGGRMRAWTDDEQER